MNRPLISVVIPTKNSDKTLELCLESIKDQIYQNYELIIVDGFSKDDTISIVKKYTDKIFIANSGRSNARNLGFSKAKGEIFLSIDSDMILERKLLEEIAANMNGHGALILPEIGYGTDFISKCKDLEKRCYIGDGIIESARAFSREAFETVRAYSTDLVFGEDWDIHWRIKERFSVGRTEAKILHNTENLSLVGDLRKAYIYGNTLPYYLAKEHPQQKEWLDLRKIFYIRHFSKLIKEPIYAFGLFLIKTMEYSFGIIGFLAAKIIR
jgi:glycosyltransferase involved in cell wall biosynthesis